jgi:hypothetical protein
LADSTVALIVLVIGFEVNDGKCWEVLAHEQHLVTAVRMAVIGNCLEYPRTLGPVFCRGAATDESCFGVAPMYSY